jgi:RNA recognition motif-containing protein
MYYNDLKCDNIVYTLKQPDNSIENCIMCVKGIPDDMSEQEFEDYFSEKYGPVRSCKISKDP